MAAAFSLRQYSLEKKRIAPEKTASVPSFTLEEIDRLGGNGRWRQRRAEEDFKQKQIEEIERMRQQKTIEEAKLKRKKELEAKRRRQLEEEERQRRAEREKEQREREEREEEQRQHEERERIRKEEEEREWLARQPKTCTTCSGSGSCVTCEGKGHMFAMFLVHAVQKANVNNVDYGRVLQGCDDCGGYRHNVMGDLKKGSGRCAACDGVGKIAPKIDLRMGRRGMSGFDYSASPKNFERRNSRAGFGSPDASPAAPGICLARK